MTSRTYNDEIRLLTRVEPRHRTAPIPHPHRHVCTLASTKGRVCMSASAQHLQQVANKFRWWWYRSDLCTSKAFGPFNRRHRQNLLNAPWYSTAPPFESQTAATFIIPTTLPTSTRRQTCRCRPNDPPMRYLLVPWQKDTAWIGMNRLIHSFDPDLWIFGSLAEDAEVWADFFNKGVKQQKYIFPFRCQKFGT